MAERDAATPARRTAGRRESGAPAPSAPDDTPGERPLNSRISADVAERAMNAFYATHAHVRWRDYVETALAEYTERLEAEHNHGEPFPQRPTDTLPRGRKVGISPRRTP
ncbi:MAG: hypothetical protein JXA67_22215 [Micromonosporaceae bacterium]|nr:hypothetical protein [Micromonosporaceae bacterium]